MQSAFNVKWIIKIVWVFVLLIIITLIGYYLSQPDMKRYQAAPISGKVIDSETGQPVQGVHVAVYWQLYASSLLGGLGGRYPSDVIGVSETITDDQGYYHIPGWQQDVSDEHYLGEESPMIGFYKMGYEFKEVYNSNMTLLVNKNYISEGYEYSKKQTEKGDVYVSNWDASAVNLVKESSDTNKIVSNLDNTYTYIYQIVSGERCESKIINKFIQAYSSYAEIIKRKYPKETALAMFNTIENIPDNCSN